MPLVVAAFGPELAPLSTTVRSAEVGIGLVAASAGAMRALTERRPRAVILVGTCGAYEGAGLAIGEVVVATQIMLASTAEARGEGAMLPAMTGCFAPDAELAGALASCGARPAAVATTLALTTSDSLARTLRAHHGADVEHLEAYAVAHACAWFGVPFGVVLAVANEVGADGRVQWLAHHLQAEVAAAGLVSRWVAALERA